VVDTVVVWLHICSRSTTTTPDEFVQPLLQRRAMSITQPECVFIALGIQHAMRMSHNAICDIPAALHNFFQIIS
jgi:hypothetical protein